jgi:hypothetical protein
VAAILGQDQKLISDEVWKQIKADLDKYGQVQVGYK